MNQQIIIIFEQTDGNLSPVNEELIASARILQQLTGFDIKIVMTGSSVPDAAIQLSEQTGIDVIVINPSGSSAGNETIHDDIVFKNLPASFFSDLNPAYIIMAHTTRGLDAAPGLAVKINAALITGVEKITRTDDGICFTRSIFSDRICAHIIPRAKTCVLTIVPGCFKPDDSAGDRPAAGKISVTALPVSTGNYHHVGFKKESADTSALDNADIIVSAGNGIREKENLDLIFSLAKLFPKSAVTGSRPICDKKWLKYAQQVGITGATVKPKLYIACGISGTSQHISGMRDSKFIVSINTDPHAAIFNISDICIIEDLTAFIPHLITKIQGSQLT